MRKARVDYRMRRRALLAEIAAGSRTADDVCDAHPELLRAATHIGLPSGESCPVCDDAELVLVTYVFETRGNRSPGGRPVSHEALARQLERYGELSVYTVEVCLGCSWHHLRESFQLVERDEDASAG